MTLTKEHLESIDDMIEIIPDPETGEDLTPPEEVKALSITMFLQWGYVIIAPEILIPADCLDDFKRVMKVGYYKAMKSKGLITDSQFEILMQMQG
jgi:hypothetical protein